MNEPSPAKRGPGFLRLLGPGLLVAATGVGAGDLATASFTGKELGVAVGWAVLLGAGMKYALNEGLARWQLATGETLLEGGARRLGWPFKVFFLAYLLPWTFFVGSALMSACGVTLHAILPVFDSAVTAKIVFGIASSAAGLVLARIGGYRLFERVMAVCIALMFCTVVFAAFIINTNWTATLTGLVTPRVPRIDDGGLGWTVGLMGGVGGTLTVLCYGYWIREEGREGREALRICRIDLATGYLMTALFGVAMVIIGAHVSVEGSGAQLITDLARGLEGPLGPAVKWAFLLGAWGAVFSSLLGVWQSVPYLFADIWSLTIAESGDARRKRVSVDSRTYKLYLYALALGPIPALFHDFRAVQKAYAIIGACFMPLLAAVLLYLNGQGKHVGAELKNRPMANLVLGAVLLFFVWAAWLGVQPG